MKKLFASLIVMLVLIAPAFGHGVTRSFAVRTPYVTSVQLAPSYGYTSFAANDCGVQYIQRDGYDVQRTRVIREVPVRREVIRRDVIREVPVIVDTPSTEVINVNTVNRSGLFGLRRNETNTQIIRSR